MYGTSWVGQQVLGGSPTEFGEARHVYNRGIRMGNLALSIQAGIAMIVSVQIGKYSILLYSVERFTTKYVYLSAELRIENSLSFPSNRCIVIKMALWVMS